MQRKPHSRRSIRHMVSSSMVLLSVVLLVIISLVFAEMQYLTLRAQTFENLGYTAEFVADSVDQQINQMNQISLTVISSPELTDVFPAYETCSDAYEKNGLRLRLSELLTGAKGFDFSIRQLNLYAPETGGFGTGEYTGDLPDAASTLFWYAPLAAGQDKLLLTGAHQDELLSRQPGMDLDTRYFSLCRKFYDRDNRLVGYVEVKKHYEAVFAQAMQPGGSLSGDVTIFDQNGNVLFPDSNASAEAAAWYHSMAQSGETDGVNPATGRREHLFVSVSEKHALTVVLSVDRAIFYRTILRSLWGIGVAFFLLLAACLAVSMLLSDRISAPLSRIYRFLTARSRTRFETLTMEDTGIQEVDALRDALNENIRATKEASDAMVVLKEQEMQAQMLALQAQMNPHFLYNSLSTIGAMAEEGFTTPVKQMCQQMTEIMRYISSSNARYSSLEEELEICDMYISCLQMRFGTQLLRTIQVPDEMLDRRIPRLCVQLLVENACKFVTTQSPPWRIDISGTEKAGTWSITVRDNGPGFDPEIEKALHAQMDDILKTGNLPSLKVEGMGLLNIFIRLYLLEGTPFIFDFGSLPEGGAFVTIGAQIRADAAAAPAGPNVV